MRKLIALSLALVIVFPQSAPAAPTFASLARKRVFSKSDVRWVVGKAAKRYDLSASDTRWLKRAAIDIIFEGAHESGGDTHAGRKRECQGILQYNSGWGTIAYERRLLRKYERHTNWRLSGIVSLYRMARVMRDGGKPAIRRHWKATLGR